METWLTNYWLNYKYKLFKIQITFVFYLILKYKYKICEKFWMSQNLSKSDILLNYTSIKPINESTDNADPEVWSPTYISFNIQNQVIDCFKKLIN